MQNPILDRIEGVFIIVNALLPAIIIIALSTSLVVTYKSAEQALGEYTRSIENVIAQAKVAKKEVQKAAKDIATMAIEIKEDGEEISKKVDAMASSVMNAVNGLGDNFADAVGKLALKVPIPVIKRDINIRFGKVLKEPMRTIGKAVAQPLKPMTNSIKDIGNSVSSIQDKVADLAGALESLKHMELYLDVVIIEYQKILNTVSTLASIAAKLLIGIAVVIAVLVLWFLLSYVFWVRRRIITGLNLIR